MLINCVAYKNGFKIADISIDQISDYLNKPETFVWVAIKDPDASELEKMRQEFNLHPLAVEDARKGNQRPKMEEYGDDLFVILHTASLEANKELSVGEVAIFVGANYILSVRSKSYQGFVNVRDRCEREPELLKNGSVFVLYALMDTVVDRYFPVIDELENGLEQIEERIFSKSASSRMIIEEVYTLKRKLMVLQHTVASLQELVGKLYRGQVPHICQGMQEYFRDVSDHIIRMSKTLENTREMTTTAIQVNLSLISLSESEVTKKLASYAALFAFPTLIAGVYGMNFRFMPELEWIWGYPSIILFMLFCDIFLWWRFRRAGWL